MRPVTLTTSGPMSSPVCPLDIYLSSFQVTLAADVTGAVNFDVQYTTDDVWASGYDPALGNWTAVTDMVGAIANVTKTIVSPVTAVRLVQNSGAGSVSLRIIQAGAIQ